MNNLGTSSVKVSPLAIGCWSFGGGSYWGEQSQQSVNDITAMALDNGINFFDTAALYNNGQSEISLGKALAGKRDRAVICSKLGPHAAYHDELIRQCEGSLRRIGTDYLDVFMLHWPINHMAVKHFTNNPDIINNPPTLREAFEAFAKLQSTGKIRAVGISNFGIKQLAEALSIAKETGVTIAVNEMPYNMFTRAIEFGLLQACNGADISVISSMALQQGILAGVYDKAEDIPPNQAHSRHYHNDRGQGTSRHGGEGVEEEMFEALITLRKVAGELNITLAQMAIAWVLNNDTVASALVGNRTTAELAANIPAMDMKLPREAMSVIDKATRTIMDKMGSSPDIYESSGNSRVW